MAQFTPSKKTIKDFNDGEEYLNRIDVVQAETINNLVEAVLYAQEHGESDEYVKKSGDTITGNLVRRASSAEENPSYTVTVDRAGSVQYGFQKIRQSLSGYSGTISLSFPLKSGTFALEEDCGTTMLTEGREAGKELKDNDYFLDVIGLGTDEAAYRIRADDGIKNLSLSSSERQTIVVTDNGDNEMDLSVDNGECLVLSNGGGSGQLVIEEVSPSLCLTQSEEGLVITEDNNELKIGDDKNNQLKIGE